MKKYIPVLLILLFTVCISSPLKSQEKIYFPYFEMINIDNDIELQYAASKLLKTYIEENHNYHVILPKKPDDLYPTEDFLESIENAGKYSAEYLLIAEINNIGSTAIISLNLYEVATGNRVWSDMIKGIPLDDFDPVLSRIGRNFNTVVSAMDDMTIDDVTYYEEEQGEKLQSFHAHSFTGILIGGNYLTGRTLNSRFGLSFYYDVSSVILNIDMEVSSNAMYNFMILDDIRKDTMMRYTTLNFSMETGIPVNRRKNTLYGTAGLDLGALFQRRTDPELKNDGMGLGIIVGGGYLLARNSTINVRFDVCATFPTYTIDNDYVVGIKFGIITSFANTSRKKN